MTVSPDDRLRERLTWELEEELRQSAKRLPSLGAISERGRKIRRLRLATFGLGALALLSLSGVGVLTLASLGGTNKPSVKTGGNRPVMVETTLGPDGFPAPWFDPAPGWNVGTTGPTPSPPPHQSGLAPQAWASNTSSVPTDQFFASSLGALPPGGIFIAVGVAADEDYPNPPSSTFPDRQLPLQISDAQVMNTWEGQPDSSIPLYLITARVLSQYLDVWVYFGNQNPSPSQLAQTQSELDRLVVPLVVLPSASPT